MKITSLALWKDPGFTDGSVEVPAITGSVLPEPDFSLPAEGSTLSLIPSKDDIFQTIRLAKEYSNLYNMNYLRAVFETGDSETLTFYGWIDNVLISSDTADYPVTVINWHTDLWRTFAAQAVFGYGLVKRRPRSEEDPPQQVSCRYRVPGEFRPLTYTGPASSLIWLVLTFTKEDDSNHVTECRTMVLAVDPTSPTTRYYINIEGQQQTIQCPSLAEILNGKYEEKLKISASQVSSAFITPYPPLGIKSISGTTITLATSSAGTSYERITDVLNTLPNYLVGGNWWVQEDIFSGSFNCLNWQDSEGNSGFEKWSRTNVSGQQAFRDWLNNHQGYVPDGLAAYMNDEFTRYFFYLDVNDFITACLGDQYTPTLGDLFTFEGAPIYLDAEYTIDSYYSKVGHGNLTGNRLVLSYNNGWHTGSNNKIIITGIPHCSFTYTQGAQAFTVGVEVTNTDGGYGFAFSGNGNYPEITIPIDEVRTEDTKEWVFTDMSGSPLGSVPWGIAINSLTERLVVNATSAYIEFRENIDSHTKGTAFTVPLPAVDVTSNSWSDYVYSGNRAADIENKRIAAEQALVSGLTGAITGGAQGAMMGGLKEYGYVGAPKLLSGGNPDPNRPIGPSRASIAHAATFGALGATAGVSSALIEYAATRYYNDRLQQVEDIRQAKQLDSIVTPGSGWDWLWHGRQCGFISLVPDDYSLSRFADSVTLEGLDVSEPTVDCTALISAGGPLSIENLVVKGPIPAEAKQYIKARFANGVRII
jgi:hypothetical protein